MDELKQLLLIFKQESSDYIDLLAQHIDALREETKEKRAEILEESVRVAHNFKGASRAAGLEALAARVHDLEDHLISARDSDEPDYKEIIPDLLKSVTEIQRFTEQELSKHGVGDQRKVSDNAPASAPEETPSEWAKEDSEPSSDTPDTNKTSSGDDVETTIRVSSARLDSLMSHAGEMLVTHSRMAEKHKNLTQLDEELRELAANSKVLGDALVNVIAGMQRLVSRDRQDLQAFDHLSQELSDTVKRVRMTRLQNLAPLIRRTVRETAYDLGKQINLKLDLGNIELDKSLLSHLRDPLLHLLRNAIDHGIESAEERERKNKPFEGQIHIVAFMERSYVRLEVSDDGRGMDVAAISKSALKKGLVDNVQLNRMSKEEVLSLVFNPSFSTATTVSQISGRGVGLSVVKRELEKVGGRADISPSPNIGGTTFNLTMPVNVLSINGLLVIVDGQVYAIPIDDVSRIVKISAETIRQMDGHPVIATDDLDPTKVIWLTELVGKSSPKSKGVVKVLILERGTRRFGLIVPEILGEKEFIVEPLPWNLGRVAFINGAIIMADGNVALSLDIAALFDSTLMSSKELASLTASASKTSPKILVVDDSITVRTLHRNVLSSAGFEVEVAVNGADAWEALNRERYDLLISDINMPKMDGYDLTKKVRSTNKTKQLPVILVSNLSEHADIEKGIKAGADEYIIKGKYDNEQLLKVVNKRLVPNLSRSM